MIEVENESCGPTSLRRAEGERDLLRALLVDAVRCLLGEVGGTPKGRARLATEARAWIASGDTAEPFSFENVCAWLEVPAGRLRGFLLEQAAKGGLSVERDGPPLRPSALEARLRRERNSRIQALRAAGCKPADIAARFGLTYGSILFICADDHGAPVDESGDVEGAADGCADSEGGCLRPSAAGPAHPGAQASHQVP